ALFDLPSKDDASMTIALMRGADLRGRVHDARSGQGIAAARVELSTGIGSRRSVATSDDGTFRIVGDDAERNSWLHVTAPGFARLGVQASPTKFVEAAMRASVPVTLRVVDPAGSPVAGAVV